jgi:hypothetical protein
LYDRRPNVSPEIITCETVIYKTNVDARQQS